MNKRLLLSAAAAVATMSGWQPAYAKSYSVHFMDLCGSSYCDGLIGESNGVADWGYHVYTTCGYSHNIAMIGIGGKGVEDGAAKKCAVFSDQTFAFVYGNENYAIVWTVQKPIVAYNLWNLWVWFGGSSSAFLGNEGILVPGQFARHRPGQKSQSSVSKLIEALKLKPVVAAN